uniref:WD_REPEATS_REGION domain-containing protein n=1 Tax=Macrostomum lignano TaxID=282301 RepID=A0A1I8FM89_9PLAT
AGHRISAGQAASPAPGPVRLEAGPSIAGSPEDEGLFASATLTATVGWCWAPAPKEFAAWRADFAGGGERPFWPRRHPDVILAAATSATFTRPTGAARASAPSSPRRGNHLSAVDTSDEHLATVGSDCSVRVYDLRTCQPYSGYRDLDPDCPEGHATRLFAARFNADGLLLTSGWDDCVKFWDLRLAAATPRLSGPHICCPDGLDVKGDRVLTGSYRAGSALQLWDARQCEAPPHQLASRPRLTAPVHRQIHRGLGRRSQPLPDCMARRGDQRDVAESPLARLELDSAVYSMAAAEDGRLAVRCRSGKAASWRDCGAQRLLDGLTAAAARGSVSSSTPGRPRCRRFDFKTATAPALPKCLQFVYLGGLVPDACNRRRPSETAAARPELPSDLCGRCCSPRLCPTAPGPSCSRRLLRPPLLYNAETWTLTGALGAQLDAAHAALVRAAFGARRALRDNESLYKAHRPDAAFCPAESAASAACRTCHPGPKPTAQSRCRTSCCGPRRDRAGVARDDQPRYVDRLFEDARAPSQAAGVKAR